MLSIINRPLPAATLPHYGTQGEPCTRPAQKGAPDPASSPPPRATPCLARSAQAGSTTLGPYVFMPLTLSIQLGSIHHICDPPGPRHVLTKAASQRKEKAEKERRIQPLPCRTVLAEVPSIVPGPASPRLVSPKNTPSSPRKQQPRGWGDGTWGVLLKRYSLDPAMAPWSPADRTC